MQCFRMFWSMKLKPLKCGNSSNKTWNTHQDCMIHHGISVCSASVLQTEHIPKYLKLTFLPKADEKNHKRNVLESVTHTQAPLLAQDAPPPLSVRAGRFFWGHTPPACPVLLLSTTCAVNILGVLGIWAMMTSMFMLCICWQISFWCLWANQFQTHALSSSGQHTLVYVSIPSALQFSRPNYCPVLQYLPEFTQHKQNTRAATHICSVWAM